MFARNCLNMMATAFFRFWWWNRGQCSSFLCDKSDQTSLTYFDRFVHKGDGRKVYGERRKRGVGRGEMCRGSGPQSEGKRTFEPK